MVSTLSDRHIRGGAALLALALGSCAPFGTSPVPPGRPVAEVYAEWDGVSGPAIRLDAASPPDVPPRVRPVIYPSKVFAVFVPEHLDRERDFKIGAHWVYIKLRESSWTEEPLDRAPPGGEPSSAADAARWSHLLKSQD